MDEHRAALTFQMTVADLFKFADGRTVFVGSIDQGEEAILMPGKCELSVGDQTFEIEMQPEMIHGVPGVAQGMRLSPRPTPWLPHDVLPCQITVKGKMRMRSNRDLIGIDSPPHTFVPDRMTLGPRLPEGWDGDAWTSPDESSYFLRAWNKAAATYAIGKANRYQDARAMLLGEIAQGGRPVQISISSRS